MDTTTNTVILKGKTRKGKTRIGMHGSQWLVVPVMLDTQPDRILVKSLNGRDMRWIHPTNDENFTMEMP